MKTKSILYLTTLLILASSIFTGCKKESKGIGKVTQTPVAFYSDKLMRDSTFLNFFTAVAVKSLKLTPISEFDDHKSNLQSSVINEVVDSSLAYDYLAEIITSEIMMKAENPGFFELTIDEQAAVMNKVVGNLAIESYTQKNADNPLVITASKTLVDLNNYQPIDLSHPMEITMWEFAGCTATALVGALGDYGSVVGQVWKLFTQGGQYLTRASIFQLAGRVVRNAVPWYKVIGITYSYATCLWAAA